MTRRQTRLTDEAALYTVGHSNRTLDELLAILDAHGIDHLVDVRRWPSSKRHPHFNQGELEPVLDARGITYTHEEAMGGYRDPAGDDTNAGWRSDGFQAYADHTRTDAWQAAFERTLDRTRDERVAVMCAEADPDRCHRRLIADAAVARGHPVVHLIDADRTRDHEIPDFARVRDDRVVYPEDTE